MPLNNQISNQPRSPEQFLIAMRDAMRKVGLSEDTIRAVGEVMIYGEVQNTYGESVPQYGGNGPAFPR